MLRTHTSSLRARSPVREGQAEVGNFDSSCQKIKEIVVKLLLEELLDSISRNLYKKRNNYIILISIQELHLMKESG